MVVAPQFYFKFPSSMVSSCCVYRARFVREIDVDWIWILIIHYGVAPCIVGCSYRQQRVD